MTTGTTDLGSPGSSLVRMRPRQGQRCQATESGTLWLATLASFALTAARIESTESLPWLLSTATVYLCGPWLFWLWLWCVSPLHRLTSSGPLVAIVWTVSPLLVEAVSRRLGVGDAPELVFLMCLQNAALMAAALSQRHHWQQLACLLSAFLALCAVVIGTMPKVYVLAGLFGVLMLWWLMTRYWERVQKTVAADRTDRCLPMRSSILLAVLLIALVLLATLGSTSASTYVLRGFMPSSGGDRWSDQHARSGVGDGDAMVAAQDEAMSFGPVESELFLDSDMPSLYDVANDMYGEPVKPLKKQRRAIALASGNVREPESQVSKTERSGREFSTVRQKVTRPQEQLEDRSAAAMLYVVGRVPMHLALERFDLFDGRTWDRSGESELHPPLRLETENGKPWAYLQRGGGSAILRGTQSHALKIINLKTNRIPSPPHLTAVHVDKVDQLDFFGWTDDSVVQMPMQEHIPQLTVMHLRSQGAALQALRDGDFTANLPSVGGLERPAWMARHLILPADGKAIHFLASQWTRDIPRGWRQVESVVSRLRSDFVLDPDSIVPEGCQDVVEHFLEARRGPDYLFATTAAVLLRELGYPTRLVSGFYAREERYSRRAGQTTVLGQDVHVWAEVAIDGRTWIPIEPTPGYEPPREALTWVQQFSLALNHIRRWCVQQAGWLLAAAVAIGMLWGTRLVWLDWSFIVLGRLAGFGNPIRQVLWTVRLLEWRARLAGYRRPQTETISRWHGSLLLGLPRDVATSLQSILRCAERILYGLPTSLAPEQRTEIARTRSVIERHVGIACYRHALLRCRV